MRMYKVVLEKKYVNDGGDTTSPRFVENAVNIEADEVKYSFEDGVTMYVGKEIVFSAPEYIYLKEIKCQ